MERRAWVLALLLIGCGSESETSGGGSAGSGAGATGGAGGSPPVAEVAGCDGATLLERPEPAETGPWSVGARSIDIQGLTAEVWYPAAYGSERSAEPKLYDLRDWLPESEKTKIPDADNPWQTCDCRPDLPLDTDHGPYPVVIFVHGTAGFRSQSLTMMTHWASRGFVVIAADHPGLYLGDMLQFNLTRDLAGDLAKVHAAAMAPSGGLGFLAGHVDSARVAMAGHSAGGGAIADQGDVARVLLSFASGGVQAGTALESTLVMGGMNDTVVAYQGQVDGYASSPPKKRLVGIDNTGHLFPSDLCWLTNASGEDIVQIANEYQIQNAQAASFLFDCPDGMLGEAETHAIVNSVTAAVLEETLHCAGGSPLEGMQSKYPAIAELEEEL